MEKLTILKKKGFFLIWILVVVDICTKYFIVFSGYDYTLNKGVSFSLGHGIESSNTLLLFLNSFLIFYVFRYFSYEKFGWFYVLIISGGIGNLIDRVFYGGVIDFIPFFFNISFNLADLYINIAVVYLIYNYRKLAHEEGF